MTSTEIITAIENYKANSGPDERYISFDYCYNYFVTTDDLEQDIERSCLTLGFYLSSWGMFRGSSFLLQKSLKHFQPTISYINNLDRSVWNIDVDKYDDSNINVIIKIYSDLKTHFIPVGKTHLTLITKVLLGVFGFIPAFDNNFCSAFRRISNYQCGFRTVNYKSLMQIKTFYDSNSEVIDQFSKTTFTTDFKSGQKTRINYPKAKIIDMFGFITGQQ
jgi:hypothetical protein